MNQIVDAVISAFRTTRRDRGMNDLQRAFVGIPMTALTREELMSIVGGEGGDDTGPRGGWKAAATTTD